MTTRRNSYNNNNNMSSVLSQPPHNDPAAAATATAADASVFSQTQSTSTRIFPSYDTDEELVTQFLRHHTIVVRDTGFDDRNNDDDDDTTMFIPTADDDDNDDAAGHHQGGRGRLRKINCYQKLFHRIRHRQYYTDAEIAASSGGSTRGSGNNNNNTTTSTFVIEIPCSELMQFHSSTASASNYSDLVQDRIIRNIIRYHDVFCTVIDQLVAEIPLQPQPQPEGQSNDTTRTTTTSITNHHQQPRNVDDILYDQRLTIQEQTNHRRRTTTTTDDQNGTTDRQPPNPYTATNHNGPLEEEQEEERQQQNANNNSNMTADFPPLLMRRYELRILPIGRTGIYPPFNTQHHHSPNGKCNPNQDDAQTNAPPQKQLLGIDTTSTTTTIIPTSIRNVRAQSIGRLVTITGMIVRNSDVKPILQVAAYACDYCGAEIYQPLPHQKEFVPATQCPLCSTVPPAPENDGGQPRRRRMQRSRGNTLYLQTRGSKFVKYQELKVQELSHHVPMGHVPRSITVTCYGECTRQGTPGDIVTIDGIYLPQRIGGESGYQSMKAGLITTTYLQAQQIIIHKKSYDDGPTTASSSNTTMTNDPNRDQLYDTIMTIANGPDPMGRLSSSIAPEIFGHADIKRSLLLQLVSGCTRTLPDGMRIRGDINILLMGDPGVAKSQLLKHVASIAPRGVYTTGKGSSGVGLTAAVTRDTTTNEMTLEGGALVFADRGICCIDEFDKMDESDRTAIHEVMEQQTVSIAKAGIVATLNARASVLAAANPIYGRYNPYKSLSDNIALPNSLLSRFDLIFLILDIADIDKDIALAKHVTYVHQVEGEKQYEKQNGTPLVPPPESNDEDNDEDDDTDRNTDPNDRPQQVNDDNGGAGDGQPLSSLILREYISRARQYHPVVPPDVAPYIVEAYVSLRMQQNNSSSNRNSRRSSTSGSNDQTVMTARQLLSTLRLSQAIARLRFSNVVAREDVDEAIRLTHMSKANLYTMQENQKYGGGGGRQGTNESTDATSKIFHILRDYSTIAQQSYMDVQLCEAMILRKGFTIQQLQDCLTEYESLDIIQYNHTKTQIHFI